MFTEKNGKVSNMRVMSFIALLAAIVFAYMTISGKGGDSGSMITVQFLGGAFAPKAFQKFAEIKGEK